MPKAKKRCASAVVRAAAFRQSREQGSETPFMSEFPLHQPVLHSIRLVDLARFTRMKHAAGFPVECDMGQCGVRQFCLVRALGANPESVPMKTIQAAKSIFSRVARFSAANRQAR